jgi:glycosyltransferase involved in cell wall biosynthesis
MADDSRILFVDHAGVLGGAELYLLDIARHYRDRCTVLLFEDGPFRERLEAGEVNVRILDAAQAFQSIRKAGSLWDAIRALPGTLSIIARLAEHARRHDVIFANSQKALVAAGPSAWWAGRPFVWSLHDILTADHFSRTNRQVAIRVANAFADRVIVNSQATQAAFERCGGAANRCAIVYNGLDADRFALLPDTRRRILRTRLGLPEDAFTVGVFSRLAPWKGQHVLIDALSDLPGVHALFVGDALFDGDESYAETLRTRAAQRGVADRTHFLGFRDDVPVLMQLVNAVVHTSTAPEPFGRVIVEGMLARRPVIATNAGGAREIVNDGCTGLLVPPGDVRALAAAVRHVADHPQQAATITEAAHARACRRFSKQAMVARIDAVLDPLLSS